MLQTFVQPIAGNIDDGNGIQAAAVFGPIDKARSMCRCAATKPQRKSLSRSAALYGIVLRYDSQTSKQASKQTKPNQLWT
jgi:hypothetical protein